MSWPWDELGLEGPCGMVDVKRAYAQKVKTAHPEDDPQGFQRLHRAYQAARQMAGRTDGGAFSSIQPLDVPAGSAVKPAPQDEEIRFEDYERLFAEGEAERRAARQRRAEKRLQEAQERRRAQKQQDLVLEDEAAWGAALEALQALETLWSAEASQEEWILFLHSSTFLNAQHNLDFIFGLEDFLNSHPSLHSEVKRHMYLTYKFYNGRPEGAYLGLYHLLQEGPSIKRRRLHKRVFREEFAPLLLLLALLSVLFIDFFFLGNRQQAAGSPRAASPAVLQTAGDGIETVKKLAVSLAAKEYAGIYTLTDAGTAVSQNNTEETFYWAQCTGQTEDGETLVMNYFLSADGETIYCIPDSKNKGDAIHMEWSGSAAAGGKTVDVYRCAPP